MKKILILIIAVVAISSCNQKSESFEISGSFTNSGNEKIMLEELSINQVLPRDSATIDEKGNFFLTPKITQKGFYRLSINPNNYIILILDSAESVSITGDASNLAETYTVKGSENSMQLWELNNFLKNNYRTRDSIQQVFQQYVNHPLMDSMNTVLEAQYNISIANLGSYIKNFIDKNPDSFVGLAAIEQLNPDADFDYFVKVDKNLSAKYPESPYVKALSNRVADMKRTAIGSDAPNITLKTPKDEIFSLSDLKGKVVLIDFWAAWCKPCRAENPNMLRLYNKYKDKGFDILGVSLDKDKESWVNAIKEDKLPWTQISDLQFWNSPVVKQYGFSGIPFTVLVDKDGKILAKGLRGQDLENKLEQVLN
ncbi:MAG: AhpC/TSA family protein [Bacteroidetes bacterium]|nr:AhpC/TSA family protein [Bacteroidota bacterium]HET6244866.1 TlpA disulfide reductase family protein [Bacteroidia bacterium]